MTVELILLCRSCGLRITVSDHTVIPFSFPCPRCKENGAGFRFHRVEKKEKGDA